MIMLIDNRCYVLQKRLDTSNTYMKGNERTKLALNVCMYVYDISVKVFSSLLSI